LSRVADVLHVTAVPGLAVLAAGALEFDADGPLRSAHISTLLDSLAEQFDLLILDLPPVLVTADASILARVADGVLLVVRAGDTSRDEVRDALQQLTTVGACVVGAVLNDPSGKAPRYSSYYSAYAARTTLVGG
jgi:receptor protein-tyrosine kinase